MTLGLAAFLSYLKIWAQREFSSGIDFFIYIYFLKEITLFHVKEKKKDRNVFLKKKTIKNRTTSFFIRPRSGCFPVM